METEMSTLREAAQALVDRWDTPLWKDALHTGQYIDALRAALAQPEQEPVAFLNEKNDVLINRTTHPQNYTPLYRALPQRKPLTEEIEKIINDNTDGDGICCADDLLAAIRAHGIGEDK